VVAEMRQVGSGLVEDHIPIAFHSGCGLCLDIFIAIGFKLSIMYGRKTEISVGIFMIAGIACIILRGK